MSLQLGDLTEDQTVHFKFTTALNGVPATLGGTPVLSVYIDEATATEKTTAETYFDLDVDFDSITGYNNVRIDTSGDAFFTTGADYTVVITTGTIDGTSVAGTVIANFSILNRAAAVDLANATDGLGAIKGSTDAVKVVTDKFVFTKANEVDANTKSINSATVVGDGNATPWDGA